MSLSSKRRKRTATWNHLIDQVVWHDLDVLDDVARERFPDLDHTPLVEEGRATFQRLKAHWPQWLTKTGNMKEIERGFQITMKDLGCFVRGAHVNRLPLTPDVYETQARSLAAQREALWPAIEQGVIRALIQKAEWKLYCKRTRWQEKLLKVIFLYRRIPWTKLSYQGDVVTWFTPLSCPRPKNWCSVKEWPCRVQTVSATTEEVLLKEIPLEQCRLPVFHLQMAAHVLMKCLPTDLVWLILSWGW